MTQISPKSMVAVFGTSLKIGGAIGLALLIGACSTTSINSRVTEPVLAPITNQNFNLRSMPAPEKRIQVAVYDLPDLTGQYAETSTGTQTMSNAVTQGGSALLIRALQDAGERRWFTVLDRVRLDDTLKERQIVTEMRRIYRDEQKIPGSVLPPLQHASIIIQGGITGYDSYVKTGGIGARYLGIGGDTKWQQDTVTINLRAVSTNTSEVLASVTVQKSIASIGMQAGLFQYVAMDRILEAEAGMTENEPRQVAVQQAIEKAVASLILEGADMGIWSFTDRSEGKELIAAYRAEKYGEKMPVTAQQVVPPATPNPTHVVPTRPASHPNVATAQPAQVAPAAAPETAPMPNAPPPAGANEVLG